MLSGPHWCIYKKRNKKEKKQEKGGERQRRGGGLKCAYAALLFQLVSITQSHASTMAKIPSVIVKM